jgi:signal peptidase I
MGLTLSVLLAVIMTGLVATDAARRGRNWVAWGLLAALTGGVGAIVWLFVRRRAPDDARVVGRGHAAAIFAASLLLVLLAAIVGIFAATFLVQLARVDGHAMLPTLADQDLVLVNKCAYRTGEPRVGELVMLYYPLKPEKTFVDRLIAEEGDSVQIRDGRVYRNDVPMRDEYVPADYRSHDDWGPQVIPEGYYFVMADHRNNASDSRHWGFVPKKYILSRVDVRVWPLSRARFF